MRTRGFASSLLAALAALAVWGARGGRGGALAAKTTGAGGGRSYIVRAYETPNDTNYSYQWHMHNTVGGIWAEAAWDLSANKGEGVGVAIHHTRAACGRDN